MMIGWLLGFRQACLIICLDFIFYFVDLIVTWYDVCQCQLSLFEVIGWRGEQNRDETGQSTGDQKWPT